MISPLQVSGELPGASPDYHVMSPSDGGKRMYPLPYMDGDDLIYSFLFLINRDWFIF